MKPFIFSLLLCSTMLQAQDKAALDEISKVFAEIEKNHDIWPHYSYQGDNLPGDHAYQHHVWQSNDDSGLIRVETQTFHDHGRSKIQYFIRGDELLFVLDRLENIPPEAEPTTTVMEKRCYFGGGKLVRLLTKEGAFAPGRPADTTGIANKTVPLAEVEDAAELYASYTTTAQAIVAKAASLDSDEAPAPAAGPAVSGQGVVGEGWRLIKGSRSQDDKFALGWGVEGKAAAAGESDEEGNLFLEPEAEGLANYVVNLQTGAILGKTGGSHWGDRPSLHQQYHSTAWSGADIFGVQVCTGKWATMEAVVFQILDDSKISPTTDIKAPAAAAARKKLKGSPQFKAFPADEFAISIHDVRFVQQHYDEVMQVGVSGQIPKSGAENSTFECTVTFRVKEGENGAAPVLTWKSTEVHTEE